MMNLMKRFVKGEEGATMVEYGIMVALIAIVSIIAVTNIGETLRDQVFQATADELGYIAPAD